MKLSGRLLAGAALAVLLGSAPAFAQHGGGFHGGGFGGFRGGHGGFGNHRGFRGGYGFTGLGVGLGLGLLAGSYYDGYYAPPPYYPAPPVVYAAPPVVYAPRPY
jgi:hypothetical protein